MITGLCDEYPKLLRKHREIFVAFLILFIYLCALPTCTYVSITQVLEKNYFKIFKLKKIGRKLCIQSIGSLWNFFISIVCCFC